MFVVFMSVFRICLYEMRFHCPNLEKNARGVGAENRTEIQKNAEELTRGSMSLKGEMDLFTSPSIRNRYALDRPKNVNAMPVRIIDAHAYGIAK